MNYTFVELLCCIKTKYFNIGLHDTHIMLKNQTYTYMRQTAALLQINVNSTIILVIPILREF